MMSCLIISEWIIVCEYMTLCVCLCFLLLLPMVYYLYTTTSSLCLLDQFYLFLCAISTLHYFYCLLFSICRLWQMVSWPYIPYTMRLSYLCIGKVRSIDMHDWFSTVGNVSAIVRNVGSLWLCECFVMCTAYGFLYVFLYVS